MRQYSLGMRQRLGLAHALLGDPEVLILDEPANGLDPEGMRWMRGLLRDFADRGGTVLLSSHLLYEVEAIADRLLIIGRGQIVAQGTREELLAGAGTLVRAAEPASLLAALDAAQLRSAPSGDDGYIVDAEPDAVGRVAAEAGVALSHLEPVRERRARAALLRTDRRRRSRLAAHGGRPMSTVALPAPVARPITRPGLWRLTVVELRKMTDTRAGFWLLVSTALITIAVAVIAALAFESQDANLLNFLAISTVPASVLLPVVGILLVTSEWNQRTAMITFTLVPNRGRVLLAKLLAGVLLALIAFQLCLICGLLATAVAGDDGDATWSLSAALIGQALFSVAVPMISGVAFGAVLLASAPAIVLYFVLPTVWGILGEIPALEGTARWLDTGRTMSPLLEEALSATQWARVGTSLALWLLVPLALGVWRVLRADVR